MKRSACAAAPIDLDVDALRSAIREEYETDAPDLGRGFHFHPGRTLVAIVGYEGEWLEGIPETVAARMVEPEGRVIGVDMTPAMLERTRRAADERGARNVEFSEGLLEALPVVDGWADVVIDLWTGRIAGAPLEAETSEAELDAAFAAIVCDAGPSS